MGEHGTKTSKMKEPYLSNVDSEIVNVLVKVTHYLFFVVLLRVVLLEIHL